MNNCDCVNCTAARAIATSSVLVMTIKLNCQSAIEAELALHLALVNLISGADLDSEESIGRLRQSLEDAQQSRVKEKTEKTEPVNARGGVG